MLNTNYVNIIVSTRPPNNHKRNTAQSMRDHEKIQKRLKSNGILPDFISVYLEKHFCNHFTSAELLSLANSFVYRCNLKIDRLAKRNRQALLCWFAENWNVIHPNLKLPDLISKYSAKYESSDSSKEDESPKENDVRNTTLDPSDINQLLNNH